MLNTLKCSVRLIVIAKVLAKHGALFFFESLRITNFAVQMIKTTKTQKFMLSKGKRLANALIELGPSFIKLGQALSTRSDLLGSDVAEDLAMLHDELPPFSGDDAVKIIEKEFSRPIDALFSEFNKTPHAAASIAQVHFAKTLDGKEVAVKILRPQIENKFKKDLRLFYWVAKATEKLQPSSRRLKPVEMVKTFEHTTMLEMDFRFEGAAISEMAENFYGEKYFKVPEVDWIRTSKRVLTTSRIHGISIDDSDAILKAGHDPKAIADKAATAMFKMVFEDGFFHGDLHPGNLFVDKEGNLNAVDFGIMGRVDEQTRIFLVRMLKAFLDSDYKEVANIHFKAGYVPADKSIDEFAQATRSFVEPILGKELSQISVAELLGRMFAVTANFGMQVQPQLLLLQKTMLMAEGVGRKLLPSANMWEMARPLVEDWALENMANNRVRHISKNLVDMIETFPSYIAQAEKLTRQMSEGVKIHPETINYLINKSSKSSCKKRNSAFMQALPWALIIYLAIALFKL